MRKRNHRRQPRAVMTDPLALLRPAPREKAQPVMLIFAAALDNLARGERPDEVDWRRLADAINSVETLAMHMGKLVPAEVMPTVCAAIAAMVDAVKRFKAGQVMRVDGAGLQALRDVVDIYGQCLDELTEREMSVAQQLTQDRVNALLHSDTPGDEVISL